MNPADVATQLRKRFMTEDWQDRHVRTRINQVVIFEAQLGDVERPRIVEEFEKVPGMRTTYSFMAIGSAGAVAQRGFGCWCKPCINAVGRAAGTMDANCRVQGCISAAKNIFWNQFFECPVNRKDPRGVAAARIIAVQEGHKLAAKIKVGDFVAFQARADEEDSYIVGVAVDCGDLCCI